MALILELQNYFPVSGSFCCRLIYAASAGLQSFKNLFIAIMA